ncbi:MAG: glycine--tRNA ligase subunit beta, partial [Eggerthellaceae bacterium]|nr:glycine--tRNA ligase subunit beta [Eggerthellaceae bacterium]
MSDTLAFEIGTEEIPAFDLKKATEQLPGLVEGALDGAGIPHGDIEVYSTPRRLIALVHDVARETTATTDVFKGPSVARAFDEDGNPTKAALGFAKSKGVEIDELERRTEKGTEYLYAVKDNPSVDADELLKGVLRSVIEGISWPRSCHWGTTKDLFSRPVRWLLAMHGDAVIPVEFANLTASDQTYGHRFLAPGPFKVEHADELLGILEDAYVITSEQGREERIRKGVSDLEKETGLVAKLPAKTLTEVINLTEFPTVLAGKFDEKFLQVPEEIIVDAMLMHQRYFPLYDENGDLTNSFIIVSNGDPAHSDTIVEGNERVVAARLYDAQFFYEEDLKTPLFDYVSRLDEVVFQEKLGTMKKKSERLVRLSAQLVHEAELKFDDA